MEKSSVLAWKLHPYQLVFIVVEGVIHASRGENLITSPLPNLESYNSDLLAKYTHWCKCNGVTSYFYKLGLQFAP